MSDFRVPQFVFFRQAWTAGLFQRLAGVLLGFRADTDIGH